MATSKDRYSTAAIGLHWLIAALLISNIAIAWYFNTLHGPAVGPPMDLHRSIGITVLLLSLGRLALRLAVPPPPMPASLTGWERALSKAVHVLFYVAMIGLPLTGWAMVSVGPRLIQNPMTLFHRVPWPAIGPLTAVPTAQVHATHEWFEAAHGLLGKMTYGLIVLHVAGVLKHQFLDRDAVVARMAPWLRGRATAPAR